jgi:hypothetical protein
MKKLLFDQLKELQIMANKEGLFEAVNYLAEIIDQNFDKIEQEYEPISEPTICCKNCANCRTIDEEKGKGECWGMAEFFDVDLDRKIYFCEYYREITRK